MQFTFGFLVFLSYKSICLSFLSVANDVEYPVSTSRSCILHSLSGSVMPLLYNCIDPCKFEPIFVSIALWDTGSQGQLPSVWMLQRLEYKSAHSRRCRSTIASPCSSRPELRSCEQGAQKEDACVGGLLLLPDLR